MLEMNMINLNTSMEMTRCGIYTDLILGDGESKIKITLSDDILEYLKQTLCPHGLIPDDFHKKIAMMNQLIEDLEDIIDVNDTNFELAKVYYNRDEDKKKGLEADMIYFETKEVE